MEEQELTLVLPVHQQLVVPAVMVQDLLVQAVRVAT
jgi:hypothetical protein